MVYFWIFLWFVLTSVCLAVSWYFFDSAQFADDEATEEEGDAG